MKLIGLLMLLAVTGMAATDNVIESNLEVTSSANGWDAWTNRAVMGSDGRLTVFIHPDTAGTHRIYALSSTDYGATWTYTLIPVSEATITFSGWFFSHPNLDTSFVTMFDTNDSLITTPIFSGVVADSLGADFDRIDGTMRGAVFKHGGRFCIEYLVDAEAGAGSDSSIVVIADSDGWPPSGWHAGPIMNGSKMGFGKRVQLHLGGGRLGVHRLGGDNDFFLIDTTSGFTEISSSFAPSYVSGGGAEASGALDLVMTDDSVGFCVFQSSATGEVDSLMGRRFVINDYAGSPSISFGSWYTLATEAEIRDGAFACPVISWLYGTDTVFYYWFQWADTASADSMDIMVAMSTDLGATCGEPAVFRQASVTDPRFRLQAPDWLIPDESGNVYRALFASGSATADDTLHFITDTLTASAPQPAPSKTTVIRKTVVRESSIR